MSSKKNGYSSLKRIIEIIADLSNLTSELARERYNEFPSLAEHIARFFSSEYLHDVLSRLELQLRIVERYNPPIRPALDPYSSTQLGIFSKNFSDWEVGRLLKYPTCCIRSFFEEVRYGFDSRHLEELSTLKEEVAFVTTAGFVPHSVFCKEASEGALIGFLKVDELHILKDLEEELAQALPHAHPEYQKHYYDILILKTLK
ncbi:MAG: DUF483 domain-containing protein [Candidatus Methanomethyliaceae archaeon]|nr:DUF483 domain-containing protein [Candidatus Methanomethyliaceae archaeon]